MNELVDTTNRSGRATRVAIHIALGIACFGALALFFGYFIMLLWNSVIADVLSVRKLSYWQGVGLLVLCRLLVGGLHTGHGFHKRDEVLAEQRRESALGTFVEHGRRPEGDQP